MQPSCRVQVQAKSEARCRPSSACLAEKNFLLPPAVLFLETLRGSTRANLSNGNPTWKSPMGSVE